MKLKKTILLIFLSLFSLSSLFAGILRVDINGGQQYTSIQSAVDAAYNGDTVLIYPGTYFENVDLGNKGICLASLHLTTGDSSYIEQTIIDGNHNNWCITSSNSGVFIKIDGLTIQNGNGGLNIEDLNNSVEISNCIIQHNSNNEDWGGGALFWEIQGTSSIINCKIINNTAGQGGGLYFGFNELIYIENCQINNNFAHEDAGGIFFGASSVTISGSTICNNSTFGVAGGIALVANSSIEFSPNNLSNIFLNIASKGTDFHKTWDCPPVHVIVDTFTVMNPDQYHTSSINDWGYPIDDITFSIQHAKLVQHNADLYVSPQGNDDNSGLSPDEALKTLTRAQLKIISDSLHPNTIHLDSGLYSPSSNGEFFPMALRSFVTIDGAGKDTTILSADSLSHIFNAWAMTKNLTLKNLTLSNGFNPVRNGLINIYESTNSIIENVKMHNGGGSYGSGTFQTRSITLKNVEVSNNFGGFQAIGFGISYSAYHQQTTDTIKIINSHLYHSKPAVIDGMYFPGGGVDVYGNFYHDHNMTAYIINCLFDSIQIPATLDCGLGAINNSDVYIVNSTFGNNLQQNTNIGGTVSLMGKANVFVYNSIFYNNSPRQFAQKDYENTPTQLKIYNSLVEGGKDEIYVASPEHVLHYDTTNINADPLWANTGYYPYMLSYGSPCINTGTLDLPEHIELPDTDLAGNPRVYDGQIDMGAYEYGPWVGVDYRSLAPPKPLLAAGPNPFHHETRIQYNSKEKGKQSIFVFDINGNKVATLMDITGHSGKGEIIWDGRNDYGRELAPGVYVVEFVVNEERMGSVKVVKK